MQITVLEIPFSFGGTGNSLFPVILRHQKEMILADGGYAGFLPLIETAAAQKGISLQQLTGAIITHHDIDHMGVHFELKQKYPSVKIYSYYTEAAYIDGTKKSLRLQQAEDLLPTIPAEYQASALEFIDLLKTMQPVSVDAVWQADEEISFLPGIQVLHTPGHMPGHISLYHTSSQILVAADAIVIEEGELAIANPQFTLDLPVAIQTIHRLAKLPVKKLICYHGGVLEENVTAQLHKLQARYPL